MKAPGFVAALLIKFIIVSNMSEMSRSLLVQANSAFREKNYQLAVELYSDLLDKLDGPLRYFVAHNREVALKKLKVFLSGNAKRVDVSDWLSAKDSSPEEAGYVTLESGDRFDADYYITKYPDIKNAGVDPVWHYINHGKAEGRRGFFDIDSIAIRGDLQYSKSKPTVLLVCHEASRTGAPILGLMLAKSLSSSVNLVVWLGRSGPLQEEFKSHCFLLISGEFDDLDMVLGVKSIKSSYGLSVGITNSVVTSKFSSVLFGLKVPSVALIHEYADYMAGAVMQVLVTANRVVFPAKSVKQSADEVFFKKFRSFPSEVVVRYQGMCKLPNHADGRIYTKEEILRELGVNQSGPKPVIVMGCGWVQIRKGVEYFIHVAELCAKLFDRPVKFMWIGGGYNPATDLYYSAWIQSQVKHSGLNNTVYFFDENKDLSPFFELADVFFLSSRLDPFPNVAIDAVKAKVPIVAFKHATGFTDFIDIFPKVGVYVPFLDCPAAAMAIKEIVDGEKQCFSPIDEAVIDDALLFDHYATFVINQCDQAIRQQRKIEVEEEYLISSGLMDKRFFASGFVDYEDFKYGSKKPSMVSGLTDEYIYVSKWLKGIKVAKSRKGFNDLLAESATLPNDQATSAITPLAKWSMNGRDPSTHPCLSLKLDRTEFSSKEIGRIAVHIHAYHLDGLSSLLGRMVLLLPQVDVFITTDSENKVLDIADICHVISSENGFEFSPNCVVVPNVGRDVAPFIMTFKDVFGDYEFIGHFHLKGTKQLSEVVVKQWQSFLFDSLLGEKGEAAIEIIDSFVQDKKLGMVFQEDPSLPSWADNFDYAVEFVEEIGVKLDLPEVPEYPTGNMFWVRSSALRRLMLKGWQWDDFPKEPVPYDGSLLHAIERITPTLCEEGGFYWATTTNSKCLRYY